MKFNPKKYKPSSEKNRVFWENYRNSVREVRFLNKINKGLPNFKQAAQS